MKFKSVFSFFLVGVRFDLKIQELEMNISDEYI